jgi:hypothetical protein
MRLVFHGAIPEARIIYEARIHVLDTGAWTALVIPEGGLPSCFAGVRETSFMDFLDCFIRSLGHKPLSTIAGD